MEDFVESHRVQRGDDPLMPGRVASLVGFLAARLVPARRAACAAPRASGPRATPPPRPPPRPGARLRRRARRPPAPPTPRQQLAAGHRDRAQRLERRGTPPGPRRVEDRPDDRSRRRGRPGGRRQLEARLSDRRRAARPGPRGLGQGRAPGGAAALSGGARPGPSNQAAFSALQTTSRRSASCRTRSRPGRRWPRSPSATTGTAPGPR